MSEPTCRECGKPKRDAIHNLKWPTTGEEHRFFPGPTYADLEAENRRLREAIEQCLRDFGDEYPARMEALEAALSPRKEPTK